MLEHIHQVVPHNRVNAVLDVQLEKKHWHLCLVEFRCQISNIQKVVMYASLFDECTLGIGDEFVHVGCKYSGHHLRD
jgi:hypothetical protein